jgi:hypothetical protein
MGVDITGLNNNSNYDLHHQNDIKHQSLSNQISNANDREIVSWLLEVEKVKPEEIFRYNDQEKAALIDKLLLVYKRPRDWEVLKDSQFKIQNLFSLEKHTIALLLNHAENVQYLRSDEGLECSIETIVNQANMQKLLILLRHIEKLPILREAGQRGEMLFALEERVLSALLRQDRDRILLLENGVISAKALVGKVNNSENHEEITTILPSHRTENVRLKDLGFSDKDLFVMDPVRLNLLFEHIDQIHYLQKLGFVNQEIMKEPNVERLKLLLTKGGEALEISYYVRFTYKEIFGLDNKRLNILLDNAESVKTLFRGRNDQIASFDRLSILLANSEAIDNLIRAGFSADLLLNDPVVNERKEVVTGISLEQLNFFLKFQGEICYLLNAGGFRDQDFVRVSLFRSRLELILRDVKITTDYMKVSQSFSKDRILGFGNEPSLLSEETLAFLFDQANSKKLLYLLGEAFKGQRFDFEGMISVENRAITKVILGQYDAMLSLLNEKNNFSVALIERARTESKLELMLNHITMVSYLRTKNFTSEEIVSMKVETLETLAHYQTDRIGELMYYGFEKSYFLAQGLNTKLCDLLLKNVDVLRIFNGENLYNRNKSRCMITGLKEVILDNQDVSQFYDDIKWLFEMHIEIIGEMKALDRTSIRIKNAKTITNLRQTAKLVYGVGGSNQGSVFGMTKKGSLEISAHNLKDYEVRSGLREWWDNLKTWTGFEGESDARAENELKALVVTRTVERTLPTKLDRAFNVLFRRDDKERIVFRPKYLPVQEFLIETIIRPLTKLIEITRFDSGKPLGMAIFENILINSNLSISIANDASVQLGVVLRKRQENPIFARKVNESLTIGEFLKRKRIAYEQDEKHIKYEKDGETYQYECFTEEVTKICGDNSDTRLLLRFVAAGLFGRSIGCINKGLKEVSASELTEADISKIGEKVRYISESTGFER